MNNALKLISCVILLFLTHNNGRSQEISQATPVSQFAIGIDNTRLIYGKYTYKQHLSAKLNVSAYSEKISFQYMRGTIGYKTSIKCFNIEGSYFFGSTLNRFYYNTGANFAGDIILAKRLLIDATLSLWYDSGFGYKTCWQGRIGCRITDHINIRLGYTTIPEYRMSENRLVGGFDFYVSNLYVSPYITVGTKASDGGKNLRVCFGFGYQF